MALDYGELIKEKCLLLIMLLIRQPWLPYAVVIFALGKATATGPVGRFATDFGFSVRKPDWPGLEAGKATALG